MADPPLAAPKADRAQSLSSATALITAARTVQVAVNLVLAIWLSHRLAIAPHATYMHVLNLASIMPVVVCAPAGKIVTYFLPRTANKGRLCRRVAASLAGIGVLVAAAVIFVPSLIAGADKGDPFLVENRAVIGLILGLNFLYGASEYVMIAREARRLYAVVLCAVAFLLLAGVGGGLLFAPPDQLLTWALTGTLAAFVLQGGMTLWFLLKPFDGDDAHAPQPVGIMAFAAPLVVSTFISQVGLRPDVFLLPRLFPSDVFPGVKGFYFRGAMEIPVLGAIAMTAVGLIAPEIARHSAAGEREEMLHLWRRSGRLVALVTLPAVGMAEAAAHELFPLVYGAPFVRSVPVFQWFALALVMRVFMPQVMLEFTGATKKNLYCGFATLVLGPLCSLFAIYVLGLGWVGFAAGLTVSLFVSNWLVGGYVLKRHLNARWSELAEWGSFLRLTIASAIGFVGSSLVVLSGFLNTWPALVRIGAVCLIYGIVFLAAALPLRAIHRDDLSMLRRIISRKR